jgi:hypothetical protein
VPPVQTQVGRLSSLAPGIRPPDDSAFGERELVATAEEGVGGKSDELTIVCCESGVQEPDSQVPSSHCAIANEMADQERSAGRTETACSRRFQMNHGVVNA